MNGQQRRRSAAFSEHFTHAMPWSLGRNHRHIHICRRVDRSVTNVESVREHEHFARGEIGRDLFFVDGRLRGVRRQQHDHVGPCGRIVIGFDCKTRADRFLPGFALRMQAHADRAAAIPQVQRVCVSLRTVSDDGDFFGLNQREVRGIVVMNRSHSFAP